ncbi:MAG: cyclic nucleotide-binding domain-containing protein [Chloroflexi bacterium]|nr:cyclic nucleotide-binding domain-containing protein [Chloroflexota bacterium]
MNTQKKLISALQTLPWLQELTSEHFEKIVEIASLCEVDAKQEIFREGDAVDYLYIVLQGRVAIDMFVPGRGRTRIYTAESMDVIGWSGVVPVARLRTAGARAVLPSHLIRLEANKLRILCEQDRSLGYIIMRKLANVVTIRLLTTRLQLLDIFAHPEAEEEMDV